MVLVGCLLPLGLAWGQTVPSAPSTFTSNPPPPLAVKRELSTPANPSSANLLTREEMFSALAEEASFFERKNRLFKQIVQLVSPSVAHIEAKKKVRELPTGSVSRDRQDSYIEEAGTGVVIQRNNRFYVVTNYHVIENADLKDIKIENGGRRFVPTRLMHDRESDLSVIAVSGNDLIPAKLGDSSYVDIGDFVIVMGSPFGLSQSVSFGIVSALNRYDLELGPQGVRYQDFIQTDAAINPGNSGGPLINLRGEVVGINTAIASNGGGSDGIGFAIPINMATRIVFDLIDYGEVRRGFLGVSLDARFTYERAKSLGLESARGALVSSITPDSPAAQAGLKVGDVILEFDNRPVSNDSHLVTRVSLAIPEQPVPMKVYREGRLLTVAVEVKPRQNFDWQPR
jgi:serine protease Do